MTCGVLTAYSGESWNELEGSADLGWACLSTWGGGQPDVQGSKRLSAGPMGFARCLSSSGTVSPDRLL